MRIPTMLSLSLPVVSALREQAIKDGIPYSRLADHILAKALIISEEGQATAALNATVPLNAVERAVLKHAPTEFMCFREIADRIGRPTRLVWGALCKLAESGLVEMESTKDTRMDAFGRPVRRKFRLRPSPVPVGDVDDIFGP